MDNENNENEFTAVFENQNVGFKCPINVLNFKNDPRFSRVVLRVGQEKKEIIASPLILASASSFFDEWFTAENREDPIDLFDMDPWSVDLLIHYLYTGILEISGTTIQNLLLSADRFQLTEVKEKCLEILAEKLLPVNCLKIREFASSHKFLGLLEECELYLKNNFTAITQCADYLDLNPTDVLRMVTTCSRKVTTNETILLSIVRWVEHDEIGRQSYLPQLLRKIDLSELFDDTPEMLRIAFAEGTILESNTECVKMYFKMCEVKAFENSFLLKQRREEVETKSLIEFVQDPHIGNELQQCIKEIENNSTITPRITSPILKNENEQENSTECELQDQIDSKTKVPVKLKVPIKMRMPSLRKVKGKVQLAKGVHEATLINSPSSGSARPPKPSPKKHRQSQAKRQRLEQQLDEPGSHCQSNSIQNKMLVYPYIENSNKYLEAYTFHTKKTKTLCEVKPLRRMSTLIWYDDRIYDMGGTTDQYSPEDDCASSRLVDIFNVGHTFAVDRIELVESRKEFVACICQDYMYVIGGCQGNVSINCAERLQLNRRSKSKWQAIDCMEFARGTHDVSVLDNKIYAIGGIASGDLSSVERFDPELDPDNNWELMPRMIEPRAFVKTAVINNKIYAVGGSVQGYNGSAERRNLNTVEVFNPVRSVWQYCPPMNYCRSRGTVLVQNDLLYAIGGDSKINPSMEVYDPRLEKWILLDWPSGLNKEVDFFTAVTITPP